MSKKPHHLEGLTNILGTLKGDGPLPSPAPAETPSRKSAKAEEPAVKGKKGRPATGKKSDEEYCTTTISIRIETRKQVKKALLDEENGKDMSDLVEELLGKWLTSRK